MYLNDLNPTTYQNYFVLCTLFFKVGIKEDKSIPIELIGPGSHISMS